MRARTASPFLRQPIPKGSEAVIRAVWIRTNLMEETVIRPRLLRRGHDIAAMTSCSLL